LGKNRVQGGAPHPEAGALRKVSTGLAFGVDKSDPFKRSSRQSSQVNSKGTQCAQSIGHDSFAARFIDGRPGAVSHSHGKAALCCGDSEGEPCRAASDYEYIRTV
jgi:hypothetical protein